MTNQKEDNQVLVIGMIDSIHLANWLERVVNSEIKFYIFPSAKFRKIHPKLRNLVEKSRNIELVGFAQTGKLAAYKQYIGNLGLIRSWPYLGNEWRLRKTIIKGQYDLVHCLEFQHAGYLFERVKRKIKVNVRLIVTNYGSDIFFFQANLNHRDRIKSVLAIAEAYSAECERDYELLESFEFKGRLLPCTPNSSLFNSTDLQRKTLLPIERHGIIFKCRGGDFGLGNLTLEVVSIILGSRPHVQVYLFSVSREFIVTVKKLQQRYGRIFYSTDARPISHDAMLDLFGKSRVYLGLSKSDGIGTSFLEAMSMGCYPIQSNTSCAEEVILKGAVGTLIDINSSAESISHKVLEVFDDFDLLSFAETSNKRILDKYYNYNEVSLQTLQIYRNLLPKSAINS